MINTIFHLDFAVNDWIQSHLTSPFLDSVMKGITFLGNGGWFWILLAVIFLCFKKTRRWGVCMAISLVISTLFTNVMLKPLIARPRPWEFREDILTNLKIPKPKDYSFPSGHTTVSFSGALALFWENKKAGTPALILATLIGFSRLYFFVHYPTDVLGGILVGMVASMTSHFLLPYLEKGVKALFGRKGEERSA